MRIPCLFLCFLAVCLPSGRAQDKTQPPATQKEAQPNATPSTSPRSSIDPAKEKDIRRLLEVAGTKALMQQMMSEMEGNIRPLMEKSLPEGEYRDKLIEAFFVKFRGKLNVQALLDLAVPVYDKHFTHEELKGLLQFYATPLGQKTIAALPQVMSEMMIAGQKIGEEVGRTSMMEVLAEHPEWEKAMEEAGKASRP